MGPEQTDSVMTGFWSPSLLVSWGNCSFYHFLVEMKPGSWCLVLNWPACSPDLSELRTFRASRNVEVEGLQSSSNHISDKNGTAFVSQNSRNLRSRRIWTVVTSLGEAPQWPCLRFLERFCWRQFKITLFFFPDRNIWCFSSLIVNKIWIYEICKSLQSFFFSFYEASQLILEESFWHRSELYGKKNRDIHL